uniref:Uncharacterized protein n=1 Tax=Graphocephala atropunctata TaxID=36148 RepID=A0A1B6M3Y1_9HEMI
MRKVVVAINVLPTGKAAGLDQIFPEFLKICSSKTRNWPLTIKKKILATGELSSTFKRSKIVTVLKSNKDPECVGVDVGCWNWKFLFAMFMTATVTEPLQRQSRQFHAVIDVPVEQERDQTFHLDLLRVLCLRLQQSEQGLELERNVESTSTATIK